LAEIATEFSNPGSSKNWLFMDEHPDNLDALGWRHALRSIS